MKAGRTDRIHWHCVRSPSIYVVSQPLRQSASQLSADDHHQQGRQHRRYGNRTPDWRCIAGLVRAVALLPVHTVLIDAPVADARHASLGDGRTATDYLAPAAVP